MWPKRAKSTPKSIDFAQKLSLLDREESLVQNIDRLFFSQDTQMRREFRRLFNTLYKKPDKYIDIIKALSKSRSGMTREELASANSILLSSTGLS